MCCSYCATRDSKKRCQRLVNNGERTCSHGFLEPDKPLIAHTSSQTSRVTFKVTEEKIDQSEITNMDTDSLNEYAENEQERQLENNAYINPDKKYFEVSSFLENDDINTDEYFIVKEHNLTARGTSVAMFDGNTKKNLNIEENESVTTRGPFVDVNEVFSQDEDGDTLLHLAVICSSHELALFIIDKAPNFTWLNIQNNLFQSPLHLAVLTNQVALVRRLVVGGADLEARDYEGNMAIHLACRDNKLECVKALLQPVRYTEQKQNNYDIPFQSIPQNLKSKNYEGLCCLHIAALADNLEVVKTLAESDANVNERAEKSGRTILHEASWAGNLSLVKYLLSLGRQCNINARSYDDYTPFELARARGHWSIVMELATAGAKYEDEKDMEI